MTKPDGKERNKKAVSIVGFTVSAILFLIAIAVFGVSVRAKRENRAPTFFGYSFSIVVTNSMEPEIKVGELLVVKDADISDVKVGDYAVFTSLSEPIKGERVVHEVIAIDTDENGLYLTTKGINNPTQDAEPVRESNFIGKSAMHSAFLGAVFGFFTRIESAMLIAVLIILIPFIVKQVKKIIAIAKNESTDGNVAEKTAENADETPKETQNSDKTE
ncbi:MAG: signal peptidase I [Clostridia bacterium]|nr:signal peptidase I [Clostridia bacterium]